MDDSTIEVAFLLFSKFVYLFLCCGGRSTLGFEELESFSLVEEQVRVVEGEEKDLEKINIISRNTGLVLGADFSLH